jgi:hypothetical protein
MNFGVPGSGQNTASGSNSSPQTPDSQENRSSTYYQTLLVHICSCFINSIGHFPGSGFPQPVLLPQNVHQGPQHPLANAIAPSDSGSDVGSGSEAEDFPDAERHEAGQISMPTPETYRLEDPGFPPPTEALGLRDTGEGVTKGEEALLDEEISTEVAPSGELRKVWEGRRTLRRSVQGYEW